jgi:predicted nucleotidyltransferase
MSRKINITEHLKSLKPVLEKKFGVTYMAVFGSYARGEGKKESDVDILVEFKQGYETFRNYMSLKEFLEKTLNKKVDLVVKSALKPVLKEIVEAEALNV